MGASLGKEIELYLGPLVDVTILKSDRHDAHRSDPNVALEGKLEIRFVKSQKAPLSPLTHHDMRGRSMRHLTQAGLLVSKLASEATQRHGLLKDDQASFESSTLRICLHSQGKQKTPTMELSCRLKGRALPSLLAVYIRALGRSIHRCCSVGP